MGATGSCGGGGVSSALRGRTSPLCYQSVVETSITPQQGTRAHTGSPVKMTAAATTAALVMSTRPARAASSTLDAERPLSSSQLWEKASGIASGEPTPHRICTVTTEGGGCSSGYIGDGSGEGGVGLKPSPSSPLLNNAGGYRREILKPSPAKENVGVTLDNGGGSEGGGREHESDGSVGGGRGDQRVAEALPPGGSSGSPSNLCKSMKRPLGGGLRASSSWDGGCASSAPSCGGGGFSAQPACRSCGGDGGNGSSSYGCGVSNGGGEFGEGFEVREACSCKLTRASVSSSALLSSRLSPLPFARGISLDSMGSMSAGGGYDTAVAVAAATAAARRHSLGEGDMFSDQMLSEELELSSSPSTGPQLNDTGRSESSSNMGGGGGGGGVEGLDMLIPGDLQNIEDCMRTLQASPTVRAFACNRSHTLL